MKISMTAQLTPHDVCEAVARFVNWETNRPVSAENVILHDDGASVNIGTDPEAAQPQATPEPAPVKAKNTPLKRTLKPVPSTPAEPETSNDNPETSAEPDAPDNTTTDPESDAPVAEEEEAPVTQEPETPAPKKPAAGSIFGKR